MLYAAAAVLEGCSFVNGGSQNTMCGALLKLAEVNHRLNTWFHQFVYAKVSWCVTAAAACA